MLGGRLISAGPSQCKLDIEGLKPCAFPIENSVLFRGEIGLIVCPLSEFYGFKFG